MSLQAVRLAMMERFADISGVTVPADPLPFQITDKTILIFPKMGPTEKIARGAGRSLGFQSTRTIDLEYHRRIPYEHLGETIGDVTTMIDTITEMAWGESASGGSRFSGTVESIESVDLMHVGALGWNEWTFGARIEISFIYFTSVNPT